MHQVSPGGGGRRRNGRAKMNNLNLSSTSELGLKIEAAGNCFPGIKLLNRVNVLSADSEAKFEPRYHYGLSSIKRYPSFLDGVVLVSQLKELRSCATDMSS